MPRNHSATEHPFAAEREYVRALNSAKLSRMMAKPFVGCLEGTTDTMTVMSLNTEKVGLAVFGTADGKVLCAVGCFNYFRFNIGMSQIGSLCMKLQPTLVKYEVSVNMISPN